MSKKCMSSSGELNTDGICVIPLVLQFYKKSESSLDNLKATKVDRMMKRGYKNETLVAQSSSKEIRKNSKFCEERSKNSVRNSNVKRNEVKESTKALPKTAEKESRKSKESTRQIPVPSEGDYDVKLEVCSTKFFSFSKEGLSPSVQNLAKSLLSQILLSKVWLAANL